MSQLSDNAELFAWYGHTNAMPLITAGQAPSFALSSEALAPASNKLDAIFSPTFNPRAVVYLPAEAKAMAGEVRGGGCVIKASDFKREVVRAEVSATAPSLVVVAQAYTSSWRAEVDGHPVPLWRANHAYQAVLVPAGEHRVELRYRDRWFQSGALVSALSLVFCVVMVVRRRPRP